MRCEIEDIRIISADSGLYDGWATIARRRNGDLWLAYSGGRESHVCPFGRVEAMMSCDGGQYWTWPRTVLDTVFDDRDGGVLETATGTLLISSFSSKAYRKRLLKILETREVGLPDWPDARVMRWQQADHRASAFGDAALGQWIIRSCDGGATWSAPIPSLVNAPHGPVQISDGSLLYAGREIHPLKLDQGPRIGLSRSDDDGQSWVWFSEIPVREGDDAAQYHELHMVEAANGDLIVQIRNENPTNADETLQSESSDGGKSWTVPHPIGVWGLPSHLLRMDDGRLMMSYGYRQKPFGNQVRISHDHGLSWSDPLVISDDGTCTDLGYPSTVQLSADRFLTLWYERQAGETRAVLRQARWRLV
jgi:sialidase-1